MRWRIRPSPEVADAIARFSIAYESDDARAVRTQKKIPQADWVAKRERFRMLDRGALYATLLEAKSKDIKTRIELLQGEAADPRITDVLNAMIAKPPFISSGTRTVWTQAFKLMVLQGDPRTVTAARAFDASSIATRWDEPSGPIAYLTSRFEKTAERIETAGEPEPASEDDLAFVASLHLPEESPDDIPQILANGLRDPSDPVARLVLADALTEHGHPRGELISLQLAIEESGGTRKEKARQSAIIRDHFDTLLGPMKPILLKGGLVFRGGFVDEAVARDPLPSLEESLKSPLWRTVRVLEAPIELIARPRAGVSARSRGRRHLRRRRRAQEPPVHVAFFVPQRRLEARGVW